MDTRRLKGKRLVIYVGYLSQSDPYNEHLNTCTLNFLTPAEHADRLCNLMSLVTNDLPFCHCP